MEKRALAEATVPEVQLTESSRYILAKVAAALDEFERERDERRDVPVVPKTLLERLRIPLIAFGGLLVGMIAAMMGLLVYFLVFHRFLHVGAGL